jgi:4-hydroxy-tetrahydrodipicolinate reductase
MAAIDLKEPHVAIQATCSKLSDAMEEITTLVQHGVHVVSIAEEMAYPAHRSPAMTDKINALAVANGVGVVGTGINPGFVLDLLVIALTGVCSDIRTITAERINDLSPYGPTVLTSQGVGLEPDAFYRGVDDGTVVGHYGFAESIYMIADALNWDIERIDEERTPIVSSVRRTTPFVTVEAGLVAGCLHKAIAYREGKPIITLRHPQQIHPQLEGVQTGDRIEISGTPDVRLAGSPEIPGGTATCALAVNMIPRLLNAAPGLYSMADLPVPSAIPGDARRCIRQRLAEHRYG